MGALSLEVSKSWAAMKKSKEAKDIVLRYIDYGKYYVVYSVDEPFLISCRIVKDGREEQKDFEANYKEAAVEV